MAIGFDWTVRATLFVDGTVYGGGPETYRYPECDPEGETPVRDIHSALRELGSVGEAIRMAMAAGIVTVENPGTRETDGPPGLDVYEWHCNGDLTEWTIFAHTYGIDVDDEGRPTDSDQTLDPDDHPGMESWDSYSGSMDWNVGGLTKVNGTDLTVVRYEREN